jgi:hypothetical protein
MQDQHPSSTASLASATPSANKGDSCGVSNREATRHGLEASRILGSNECEPWWLYGRSGHVPFGHASVGAVMIEAQMSGGRISGSAAASSGRFPRGWVEGCSQY